MKNEKVGIIPLIAIIILGIFVVIMFIVNNSLDWYQNEVRNNVTQLNETGMQLISTGDKHEDSISRYISDNSLEHMKTIQFSEQEYKKYRREFEKLVNILDKGRSNELIKNLRAERLKLEKSKEEAVALAEAEKAGDAEGILENNVYLDTKSKYSKQMKNIIDVINNEAEENINWVIYIQKIISMLRLIVTIFLVLLSLILFLRVRKYIKEQQVLIKEIEDANATLEMKVEDRTRDAEEKNYELQSQMEALNKISRELEDESEERKVLQEESERNRLEAEGRAQYEEALSNLSYGLSGSLSINEACEKSIEIFSKHITIYMGGVYVQDDKNVLVRKAVYSYPTDTKPDFALGEGSVGQAAKQKRQIIVNDIPSECVLSFGGGNIKPVQLVETPMIYNNMVIGVLEIAVGRVLSNDEINWINKAAEIMAVSIFVIRESEKLKTAFNVVEEVKENIKMILDSTDEGIYGVDNNGNITFCNNAAIEMFGYKSQEELIGKNNHIVFHNKHSDGTHFEMEYCPLLKSIKEGMVIESEEYFWRADGTGFWAEASSNPIKKEGEIKGAVVAFRDITDKKIIEEERSRERGLLQGLVRSITGVVFYKDTNGNYLGCNEEFAAIIGKKPEDIIGKNEYEIFTKEKADMFIQSDKKVIEEQNSIRFEEWVEYSDGRKAMMDTVKSVLKSEDGKVIGVLGLGRDMTDRKKAEMEMIKAKQIAEEATKAKSDFLANMSHEIRTPMNAIIGLNGLLERTELNKKQFDYVIKVGNAAKNLLGIINDILDFSKIEAGKMDMEMTNFNLEEVLDNISNVIGTKAFEKGLELVIAKDLKVPENFIGDPLRLSQVMINLANNAVKFTEKGEVVIKIKCNEILDGKAKLYFAVDDTGIGMTPEQLSKLFKAFSQADASTTRKYGGTGLGLTISKNIIEIMGGEIEVTSEYGKGSSFHFTITLDIAAEKKEKRSIIPERLQNINVIVADDNDAAREVIAEYVESFGMHAILVSSGEEALSEASEKTDLILMDWKMMGINGIEAWRRIKEKLPKKRPQIMILTAYGREEVIKEAKSEGIEEILTKPIHQSMLFDSIIQLFGEDVKKSRASGAEGSFVNLNDIKGAKILLVEDNEINQQVARENLEIEGFWVDVADNGRVAVDKILKAEYDIVLMDIQMPVLDGYMAAQEIRTHSEYSELPIIALSADAMSGTRERVMTAGMNDYITKPIDKKDLFETLIKWVKPGKREVFKVVKSESEEESIEGLYKKLTVFNVKDGLLRLGGNYKLYVDILRKFEKSNIDFISRVTSQIENRDIEDAARELHTIKGVASNIGGVKIQKLAASLEKQLKDGRDILKTTEFEELRNEIEKGIEEIEKLNKGTHVNSTEIMGKEVLAEKIKELKELLDNYDTKSDDVLALIRPTLDSMNYGDDVNRMEKMIKAYNFEDALEICGRMYEEIIK